MVMNNKNSPEKQNCYKRLDAHAINSTMDHFRKLWTAYLIVI